MGGQCELLELYKYWLFYYPTSQLNTFILYTLNYQSHTKMKFSTTLIALVASTVIASPFPDQSLTTLVTVTTSSTPEATASSTIEIPKYNNSTDTDAVQKAVSLGAVSSGFGIASGLATLINFAKEHWPSSGSSN
ncbi:unnamed protein product [Ambrosiozyma monospora]|uniref:Unnamed protein product n=1 Tax=Ambrosiozyma monospora TaxID=43982 RepID=A0ACB5SVU8_AMBMO|nr:unnamed protein product [Ambrosiozyma monospora]